MFKKRRLNLIWINFPRVLWILFCFWNKKKKKLTSFWHLFVMLCWKLPIKRRNDAFLCFRVSEGKDEMREEKKKEELISANDTFFLSISSLPCYRINEILLLNWRKLEKVSTSVGNTNVHWKSSFPQVFLVLRFPMGLWEARGRGVERMKIPRNK